MLTSIILSAVLAATPILSEGPVLRENNIKEVISAMTLEEKFILLVGGNAAKSFYGIGNS